jgi:uncharacterized protein (DUF1800 family)
MTRTSDRLRGSDSTRPHLHSALTRRSLFGATAGATAALGLASQARASAPNVHKHVGGAHTRPRALPAPDLLRLVNRITQGYTAAEYQHALSLGYESYLEEQLHPELIDDSATLALLAAYPTLTMTSKQLYDTYTVNNQTAIIGGELKAAAIVRSVFSKRQLFERMVEFWTDHFNIDINDTEPRTLKTADDRDVIRTYALGTFHDLLNASAHSGAMLTYLDNYANKKAAPNENYAREVLELHTLSVGNYTENDIKEFARCLTGWSRWPTSSAQYGDFRFVSTDHDTNSKSVLGLNIPAGGGENDAQTVLDFLATHSSTAHFLALKLLRWFVSYDPPQTLVDRVADRFLATGGDIKSVLRVVLDPQSFADAGVDLAPKLKRPFHLVTSALRASKTSLTQPNRITLELEKLGQGPFEWSPPNGYPDTLEDWGFAVLPRWSFLSRFFDNKIQGNLVDMTVLLAGVSKSAMGAAINQLLTGGTMAPEDVQSVQAYVNLYPSLTDAVRREALAMATSSPSYQYY